MPRPPDPSHTSYREDYPGLAEQYQEAEIPPARPFRSWRLAADAIAVAVASFLIAILYGVSGSLSAIVESRQDDAAARLVLRDNVTEQQAQELAQRIRRLHSNVDSVVIPADEIRAALALQESWMQNLPEVQLGELPTVIELRLHDPGPDASVIEAQLATLEAEPEVLFSQFDSLGYDALTRSMAPLITWARLLRWPIISAIVILLLLYALRVRCSSGPAGRLAAAAGGAFIGGICGTVLGAQAFSRGEIGIAVASGLATALLYLLATTVRPKDKWQ